MNELNLKKKKVFFPRITLKQTFVMSPRALLNSPSAWWWEVANRGLNLSWRSFLIIMQGDIRV